MDLFGFLGGIFGWVLYGAYWLVHNYGLAILIFTIFTKLIFFPSTIKQQKSMAKNARLSGQMQALREKYGTNREKLNEETQKLYEKEGVSPYSGCLSSLLPMFLLLGVFYAVAYPLTNTLHIDAAMVENARQALTAIPGLNLSTSAQYGGQVDILMYFNAFPSVQNCFSADMIEKIGEFSNSFNLCGLNLLVSPSKLGFSVYLIIPVLCFVTSVASQLVMQKMNGSAQNQQGCMKLMMYGLPLFSAYIAYTVPAAVGFYWICSTAISFVQSIIVHKFFGPDMMIARGEAARVALLEQKENLVK
ncbi:MAG: YidC/Oxa1 family membrane protein insertase [Ruminococcus sp.]|nr:YidC/Oxa1 family membrane protein insertase [Ruminococcus sp.]MDO4418739.1 YidC/Oxa1 family membrane protein insertase [Ruminococcus sp.]